MTQILSASRIVDRRCATTSTVMLQALMSASSASCTQRSDSASSADVASSSSRTDGSRASARAIAMRCFCPPESAAPRSPTSVAVPSGSASTKDVAFAIARQREIFSSSAAPSSP
mmetsp:Transcript_7956/g.23725  ORF Transcript_7956/g.23725 Transcript_7956/m.23725 type:complete len:115 (+) Transcript_7956:175-519(+)